MDKILLEFKRQGRAAFKTREFAQLLGKPGYARLVLHRLKARGVLVIVKKGVYAFPEASPESIAVELSKPCYLSFHSALYLHGLTTQIPRRVQLAVLRYGKKYAVPGGAAQEYKVKRASFTGFKSKDGLPLASPEKAFADCLNAPRACPAVVLVEALPVINRQEMEKFLFPSGKRRLKKLVAIVR